MTTQQIVTSDPIAPVGADYHPPVGSVTKKFPLLIVLLSVVSILAISFGVFTFLQMQTLKSQMTTQPSTSPAPTTIASIDPTANWKTYNFSEMGYSLQYPDSMFKYENDQSITGLNVSTEASNNDLRNISLSISAIEPNADTPDKYIQSNPRYSGAEISQIKISNLDGFKVIYASLVGTDPHTSYTYEALVWKDSKVFVLAMSSQEEKSLNKYADVFNQIISTFKFTN